MAVNVTAYVGYLLAGIRGALVSMAGVLLPAFLSMLILSALYFSYGNLPVFNSFFRAVMPALCAIILYVAFGMGKKNIGDAKQVMIMCGSIIVLALVHGFFVPPIVMLIGALLGVFMYYYKPGHIPSVTAHKNHFFSREIKWAIAGMLIIVGLAYVIPDQNKYIKLIFTFGSMSVTLFGGGYVVIPAMHNLLVEGLKWVTSKEFADGIALGQVTPGPIFVSATFVGYKVAGVLGAILATIAIFLPSAVLMVISTQIMESIKNSPVIQAAFKGLRPAVIGMIIAAVYTIGKGIAFDWTAVLIFITALVALLKFNLSPVLIIPLSGMAGLLIY